MDIECRKMMWELHEAAAKAAQYALGEPLESFASQPMRRSAVLRELQLVGRSLERLALKDPVLAGRFEHARRFANLAQAIRHDDAVADIVVWEMVQDDLPRLLETLEEIIAQERGDS